jgi:hypothetical protein
MSKIGTERRDTVKAVCPVRGRLRGDRRCASAVRRPGSSPSEDRRVLPDTSRGARFLPDPECDLDAAEAGKGTLFLAGAGLPG